MYNELIEDNCAGSREPVTEMRSKFEPSKHYSMEQYITVRRSTLQYGAVHYSTEQYITVQSSTSQYAAVH